MWVCACLGSFVQHVSAEHALCIMQYNRCTALYHSICSTTCVQVCTVQYAVQQVYRSWPHTLYSTTGVQVYAILYVVQQVYRSVSTGELLCALYYTVQLVYRSVPLICSITSVQVCAKHYALQQGPVERARCAQVCPRHYVAAMTCNNQRSGPLLAKPSQPVMRLTCKTF